MILKWAFRTKNARNKVVEIVKVFLVWKAPYFLLEQMNKLNYKQKSTNKRSEQTNIINSNNFK